MTIINLLIKLDPINSKYENVQLTKITKQIDLTKNQTYLENKIFFIMKVLLNMV